MQLIGQRRGGASSLAIARSLATPGAGSKVSLTPPTEIAPVTGFSVVTAGPDTGALVAGKGVITLGATLTATRYLIVQWSGTDKASGQPITVQQSVKLIPGTLPGVVTIPNITPGAAWDGTAGSGYQGNAPVQSGLPIAARPELGNMHGTIAPVAQWVRPIVTDGFFSDDINIAVATFAADNNDGVGGIQRVRFYLEGATADAGDYSVTEFDRNGAKVQALVFQCRIPYASVPLNGDLDVYAEITPKLAGIAPRVIGPMRISRKPGYDKTVLFGTATTVPGEQYPTLKEALNYAATAPYQHMRLVAARDYTETLTGQAHFTNNKTPTMSQRRQVTVDANGYHCLMTSATRSDLRTFFRGLRFVGWRFDVERVNNLYSEADAGYILQQFERCEFFQTNGPDYLINGSRRDVQLCRPENAFIDCRFTNVQTGDFSPLVRFACSAWGITGDWGHTGFYPSLQMLCDVDGNDASALKVPHDTIQLAYASGAGAATYDITGTSGGTTRTLTLKNGGAVTTSFTLSNVEGTGIFWPSELVAAINAFGNGWSATLLDASKRRRASHIGAVEGSSTAVPVATPVPTSIWLHTDAVQLNGTVDHENVMVYGNTWRNSYAQLVFACVQNAAKSAWNIAILFNGGNRTAAALSGGEVSQISGRHKHTLVAGNTLLQELWFRRDMAASFGWEWGEHCRFVDNAVQKITLVAGGADTSFAGVLARNHAWEGLIGFDGIASVTENSTGGSVAADFENHTAISSRDGFRPKAGSTLRQNLKPRSLKADLSGTLLTSPAPAGAIIAETAMPTATVILSAIAVNVLDEGSPQGTVVGTFDNATDATFTLLDNAGGRFAINGADLVAGPTPTNFAASSSHRLQVEKSVADAKRLLVVDVAIREVPKAITPPNWDAVFVGTSIIENGVSASLGTNGLTRRLNQGGFPGWVGHATGYRIRAGYLSNFGIGGNNLAQIINEPRQMNTGSVTSGDWFRGSTSTEKSLSIAKAHPAGIAIVEAFTNDNTTTAANFQARVNTLLAALTDANPAVNKLKIMFTPTAFGKNAIGGAGSGNSTGMTATMKANVDWLKTFDCKSGHANARQDVIVVDCLTPTSATDLSTAGPYFNKSPGYLRDGLHDTPWLARYRWELATARLAEVYGAAWDNLPRRFLKWTNANKANAMNSNPLMTIGAPGTVNSAYPWSLAPVAANVPTGFTIRQLDNANLGCVITQEGTDADGVPIHKLVFSGTLAAGAGNRRVALAQPSTGGHALTDKARCFGSFMVEPGSVGLAGVSLSLETGGAPAAAMQSTYANAQSTAAGAAAIYSEVAVPGVYDIGGEWVDLQTDAIDASDANMSAASRAMTSITNFQGGWIFSFTNTDASNPKAINATVYVKGCGVAPLHTAFGAPYA